MRAAVCRESGSPFVVEEVDLAPPETDEIVVRMGAVAICHSDVIFADGGWGGGLPAIYGHEAAGVVEAIGPGVDDLKPGDHVIVTLIRSCGRCPCCAAGLFGSCEHPFDRNSRSPLTDRQGRTIHQGLKTAAFAERSLVHRSQVVKIDFDLPFDVASLLACGVITGFGAVANSARMRADGDVVVIGAGGVGLNSVQAAAILGARRIMAVDVLDAKLDAAGLFGATHAVNARRADPLEAVRDMTGGRGADYVFVTVGAKAAIDGCYPLLAPGGTAVIVGMPEDGVTSTFDPGALANASQRVIGSKMGAADIAADIPKLIALYQEGRLRLDELITGRFAFEDINQAMAAARAGTGLRSVLLFDQAS